MQVVTFNCGGERLVVNPCHVASIQPYEASSNKTLLTVLGHTYKLRGSPALIKAALGWEDGPVVGFDTSESQEWKARLLRTGHDKSTEVVANDDGNSPSSGGPSAVMGAPITVIADDEVTSDDDLE